MYRTLRTIPRRTNLVVRNQIRPLSVSSVRCLAPSPTRLETGKSGDKKHATSKVKEGDTHNIQAQSAKAGMEYVFRFYISLLSCVLV